MKRKKMLRKTASRIFGRCYFSKDVSVSFKPHVLTHTNTQKNKIVLPLLLSLWIHPNSLGKARESHTLHGDGFFFKFSATADNLRCENQLEGKLPSKNSTGQMEMNSQGHDDNKHRTGSQPV